MKTTAQRMWMIRGDSGTLYDLFRDRSLVAIGWNKLAPHAKPGIKREDLIKLYKELDSTAKQGTAISGASQVWRFVNEIKKDDWVITYSPLNRTYMVGKITGASGYREEWADDGMPLVRPVQWESKELHRDQLSDSTKNALGATLTIFSVSASATQEILAQLAGQPIDNKNSHIHESNMELVGDPLAEIEFQALERIKDRVNELSWDDMQELVAGILRAMGYKTQISAQGADRGKDIVASPDGFGFEHPRIVVEVKHRKEQMGSQAIRSFLGGRHKDDRGLYVSTGGFSKDALYEADRAAIPLAMWTLDHVVRALIEHYDETDTETKRLVPLKRLYWLA